MGFVRLLLAVSVVIFHSHSDGGFILLPGALAVEMFFIISGFYMSLVLTEKYDPRTWGGIVTFYQSRFLRLWPTFAVATVVVWVWSAVVTAYVGRPPTDAAVIHQRLYNQFASAAIMLSNLTMIGQDVPSLFHVSPSGAVVAFRVESTLPEGWLAVNQTLNIAPAWTVGVEIWFYLLMPFLVRAPTSVLVALMVASGTLRYAMFANELDTTRFFPTQMCLFLVGALAHRLGVWAPLHCRTTAITNLLVVACGCIAFGSTIELSQHFKWVLYGAFAATMYGLFQWSGASSFDRLIGEMSYPVYITHLIVAFIVSVVAKRLGVSSGAVLLLMLVLPLSLALVLFVEMPIARFRARIAKHCRTFPG
jgi:peptidoglycan/LPS O-acetylase OafA/YrhL